MMKGISSKLKDVQDKLIMLHNESREQKGQIDNLHTLGQERDLKIEKLEPKLNENTRALEQYKIKTWIWKTEAVDWICELLVCLKVKKGIML